MDIDQHLRLLGGLTPRLFMKRHWQRKPLLVRGALDMERPLLHRSELFRLAAMDEVESRVLSRSSAGKWSLRRGPFQRRSLPPLSRPGWTLLVQGVDLHDDRASALLQQFSFDRRRDRILRQAADMHLFA